MPIFRRNTAEVVRRGVGDESIEELKTRKIGRKTVKVRRVRELPARPANGQMKRGPAAPARKKRKRSPARTPQNKQSGPGRHRPPRPRQEGPGAELPEGGRKQMLVRVLPIRLR